MATVTYEFDELNRLVIRDPEEALEPRRVVDGRLALDRTNRLSYQVRSKPGSGDVLLDGTWTLSPQHVLGLLLHPTDAIDGQTVFLRGSVVDVRDDALIVSLTRRTREGRRTSQRLALSGRWQADARNRLTFLVAKADGREDRLIFEGAWDVDRTRRLVYRLDGPRRGALHTLEFSGAWDLRPGARLAYRLGADSRSAFEFQAALQSPTLQAREGRISYQIGVRLSDGRTIRRTVTFFGVWKLNRNLSVSFEMAQPSGGRRTFAFEGEVQASSRASLSVQVRARDGEPLGFAVVFSRSFLQDTAQWFVRLERAGEETRVLGGVQVRF